MATSPTNPTPASVPEGSPSNSAAPNKKKASRFVTPILALVAVLAVGVFGGILIGQNTASSSAASGRTGGFPGGGTGTTQEGGFGGGQGGAGGNFTTGTVSANADGTLTITTTDGSTVKVTTGDDTTVTTEGTVDDLTEGETVTVIGTTDDDGNVTATRISEGETTGGFGGGAPGGTAPTAAPSN